MTSWTQARRDRYALAESHTPYGEIIGVNNIVITAAVSDAPRAVFSKDSYYWTMELWEPGAKFPIHWKVLFPSGLFDQEMISLSEGAWVSVHGYVTSFYEKDVVRKGVKMQKFVLVVNGTDIHVMRKRAKKKDETK